MCDQKKILKAIEEYDYYSEGQKKILFTLYQLSIDNIAIIKVANLANMTGYSRYMIYKTLEQFKKDGVLKTLEGGQKSLNTFKFSETKLQDIVEVYNKRNSIIN